MSTVLREVIVPAREGRAIEVHAGEHLSLIDLEGNQVADFVAIHRADPHRFVSVQQTRTRIFRYNLAVGDLLVDVHYEPFFELVRDDVGQHDMFQCACNPALYRDMFGQPEHPNCRMNLLGALAPYGVEDWWLPDPINFFENTPPLPDGTFGVYRAISKPGDRVVLRALVDAVVAVSACPFPDIISGEQITPLKLEVT